MFIRRRRFIPDRLLSLAPAPALLSTAIVRDRRATIGPRRRGWIWLPAVHLGETPNVYPWRPAIGQRSPGRGVAAVPPVHLPETPTVCSWEIVAGPTTFRSGAAKLASLLPPPLPKIPFAVPTRPAVDPVPWLRRRRGWILRWPPANIAAAQAVWYHIYSNTGAGDPINYQTPVAAVDGLSWSSASLAYPGDWKFGVRAFYVANGLEEQNLDCAIEIILDSSGNDITNRPQPPTGLRALAIAGGNIKVEWGYFNPASAATTPLGFHVYIGVGSLSYATPAATVSYASSIMNAFMTILTGLTSGTTYTIGVRAYNATAEEPNTVTIACTSDATGPSAVQALSAIAV
jgi:hypothetical protein